MEPEILSDGNHSIDLCQKVTEKVNRAVFAALGENNIFFEGMLLKPNMVTPGSLNAERSTVSCEEIAFRTVTALSRSVLPSCVGIMVKFNINISSYLEDKVRKKHLKTLML